VPHPAIIPTNSFLHQRGRSQTFPFDDANRALEAVKHETGSGSAVIVL
jgi:hypothetical protein